MSRLPTDVLSASRTRDMVRVCPDLLADVLLGRRPFSPGRARPTDHILDLRQVRVLVLWTKDPTNLVRHGGLRRALETFLALPPPRTLALHLTCTGLGGTPVEYGVPPPDAVAAALREAVAAGLVDPRVATLRVDPLGDFLVGPLREPAGPALLSNARLPVLEGILGLFLPLGLQEVVVSAVQVEPYPAVGRRGEVLEVRTHPPSPPSLRAFLAAADALLAARGARLSVCVEPAIPGLTGRRGCIDTRFWRRVVGATAALGDERLHTEVGSQRRGCRCTFSLDLGYTAGVGHCPRVGSLCAYCYASPARVAPSLSAAVAAEASALAAAPARWLRRRGLDPRLAGGL